MNNFHILFKNQIVYYDIPLMWFLSFRIRAEMFVVSSVSFPDRRSPLMCLLFWDCYRCFLNTFIRKNLVCEVCTPSKPCDITSTRDNLPREHFFHHLHTVLRLMYTNLLKHCTALTWHSHKFWKIWGPIIIGPTTCYCRPNSDFGGMKRFLMFWTRVHITPISTILFVDKSI